MNKTYSNQSHIDFEDYDKGLYTTFDLASQLNINKNQGNDMRRTYGNHIIKLAVKGIYNFWFCIFGLYKKFHPNANINTWKKEQAKHFNLSREIFYDIEGSHKEYTERHSNVSHIFEENNIIPQRVKGIIYEGQYDGNCILIYDWTTAVPLSYSNNEGKTWKKIDKDLTTDFRKNFKGNDYIDTNKSIHKKFKVDERGDLWCIERQLRSLQGAPQNVGRDFNCYLNRKLTSLQGAPQNVGGNFNCYFNRKLTKEEILKYLKTAKINGEIHTNFGNFNDQKTAIEQLSKTIKEEVNYFNY